MINYEVITHKINSYWKSLCKLEKSIIYDKYIRVEDNRLCFYYYYHYYSILNLRLRYSMTLYDYYKSYYISYYVIIIVI